MLTLLYYFVVYSVKWLRIVAGQGNCQSLTHFMLPVTLLVSQLPREQGEGIEEEFGGALSAGRKQGRDSFRNWEQLERLARSVYG